MKQMETAGDYGTLNLNPKIKATIYGCPFLLFLLKTASVELRSINDPNFYTLEKLGLGFCGLGFDLGGPPTL